MSTSSIRLSSKASPSVGGFPSSVDTSPKSLPEFLIETTGIQPEDRVLVVGASLSEHLAGLARHGCAAASGIHPGALCLHHEAADVIWLIAPFRPGDFGEIRPVPEIGGPIRALLHRIGDPRLLAIALPAGERAWVQDFLYRLGANGLVLWSYHRYGDRLVVTASRPGWLRGVSSNRRAGL